MRNTLLLLIGSILLLSIGGCGNKQSPKPTSKQDSISDTKPDNKSNIIPDSIANKQSVVTEDDISIDPNASPENVVKILIKAGKTGKYITIAKICNDAVDKDGDAKEICDIANASPEDQADFNEFFGNARIVGKVRIRNGIAEVDIETSAEGGDKETIIVQNKYDRWYLKGL